MVAFGKPNRFMISVVFQPRAFKRTISPRSAILLFLVFEDMVDKLHVKSVLARKLGHRGWREWAVIVWESPPTPYEFWWGHSQKDHTRYPQSHGDLARKITTLVSPTCAAACGILMTAITHHDAPYESMTEKSVFVEEYMDFQLATTA